MSGVRVTVTVTAPDRETAGTLLEEVAEAIQGTPSPIYRKRNGDSFSYEVAVDETTDSSR